MTARKETIEEIERVLKLTHENSITVTIPRSTAERAVSMLKEQEPKTVLHREDGDYCPRCSTINTRVMGVQKLHLGTRYCPYCGQAVKW